MKPITPKQVRDSIEIPNAAMSTINKILVKYFTGTESIFTKEILIRELLECGYNSAAIDNIINNMPKVYRQYNWNIEETKTGFIFTELLN